MSTYSIKGFPSYFVFEKILYRKAYKTKSKSCKSQYRCQREINQTVKNCIKGFWMIKYDKRVFMPIAKLLTLVNKNET